MSRGLGQVQQRILSILSDGEEHRLGDLAGRVFGAPPPAAQYNSTTRAVRGLRGKGLVSSYGKIIIRRGRRWTRHYDELSGYGGGVIYIKRCENVSPARHSDNT